MELNNLTYLILKTHDDKLDLRSTDRPGFGHPKIYQFIVDLSPNSKKLCGPRIPFCMFK